MTPFLTYPLAFLGLVAVPVLVGIYLLRNRFRRHWVSSLMLWAHTASARQGGRRLERVQVPLAFLLELMAIVLLVCAAVDPRWPRAGSSRPLVLVLDNSVSMLAQGTQGLPRTQGQRAVLSALRAGNISVIHIVLADVTPRLLGPFREPARARAALEEWTCTAPCAGLDRALSLAVEVGGPLARYLAVTDRAPAASMMAGREMRWLAFGAPLPNAGIVHAARSGTAGKERCLLEVAAFGDRPVETVLTIDDGAGGPARVSRLSLGPGATQRVLLEPARRDRAVRATLAPDALAPDNDVVLLAERRRGVRCDVRFRDAALGELVRGGLEASGLHAAAGPGPELVLTDSAHWLAAGPGAWQLSVLAGDGEKAFAGPYVASLSHPLLEGIVLDGVIWGVASDGALPGTPIVMAGNVPLLSEQVLPDNARHLRMRLAPGHSTLQESVNWPVFWYNLLAWRAFEAHGAGHANVRAGSELVVPIAAETETVVLRTPDSVLRPVPVQAGRAFVPVRALGVHEIVADGRITDRFAVNLLAPGESDLNHCVSGEWGEWLRKETRERDYASLSWLFVLLATSVLVGHMALLGRGNSKFEI